MLAPPPRIRAGAAKRRQGAAASSRPALARRALGCGRARGRAGTSGARRRAAERGRERPRRRALRRARAQLRAHDRAAARARRTRRAGAADGRRRGIAGLRLDVRKERHREARRPFVARQRRRARRHGRGRSKSAVPRHRRGGAGEGALPPRLAASCPAASLRLGAGRRDGLRVIAPLRRRSDACLAIAARARARDRARARAARPAVAGTMLVLARGPTAGACGGASGARTPSTIASVDAGCLTPTAGLRRRVRGRAAAAARAALALTQPRARRRAARRWGRRRRGVNGRSAGESRDHLARRQLGCASAWSRRSIIFLGPNASLTVGDRSSAVPPHDARAAGRARRARGADEPRGDPAGAAAAAAAATRARDPADRHVRGVRRKTHARARLARGRARRVRAARRDHAARRAALRDPAPATSASRECADFLAPRLPHRLVQPAAVSGPTSGTAPPRVRRSRPRDDRLLAALVNDVQSCPTAGSRHAVRWRLARARRRDRRLCRSRRRPGREPAFFLDDTRRSRARRAAPRAQRRRGRPTARTTRWCVRGGPHRVPRDARARGCGAWSLCRGLVRIIRGGGGGAASSSGGGGARRRAAQEGRACASPSSTRARAPGSAGPTCARGRRADFERRNGAELGGRRRFAHPPRRAGRSNVGPWAAPRAARDVAGRAARRAPPRRAAPSGAVAGRRPRRAFAGSRDRAAGSWEALRPTRGRRSCRRRAAKDAASPPRSAARASSRRGILRRRLDAVHVARAPRERVVRRSSDDGRARPAARRRRGRDLCDGACALLHARRARRGARRAPCCRARAARFQGNPGGRARDQRVPRAASGRLLDADVAVRRGGPAQFAARDRASWRRARTPAGPAAGRRLAPAGLGAARERRGRAPPSRARVRLAGAAMAQSRILDSVGGHRGGLQAPRGRRRRSDAEQFVDVSPMAARPPFGGAARPLSRQCSDAGLREHMENMATLRSSRTPRDADGRGDRAAARAWPSRGAGEAARGRASPHSRDAPRGGAGGPRRGSAITPILGRRARASSRRQIGSPGRRPPRRGARADARRWRRRQHGLIYGEADHEHRARMRTAIGRGVRALDDVIGVDARGARQGQRRAPRRLLATHGRRADGRRSQIVGALPGRRELEARDAPGGGARAALVSVTAGDGRAADKAKDARPRRRGSTLSVGDGAPRA